MTDIESSPDPKTRKIPLYLKVLGTSALASIAILGVSNYLVVQFAKRQVQENITLIEQHSYLQENYDGLKGNYDELKELFEMQKEQLATFDALIGTSDAKTPLTDEPQDDRAKALEELDASLDKGDELLGIDTRKQAPAHADTSLTQRLKEKSTGDVRPSELVSDIVILDPVDYDVIDSVIKQKQPNNRISPWDQQMMLTCQKPSKIGVVLGEGQGIFVSPNGYFVTAYHVIKDFVDSKETQFSINYGNLQFTGKPLCYSRNRDLALLIATGSDEDSQKKLGQFSTIHLSDEFERLTYVIKEKFGEDELILPMIIRRAFYTGTDKIKGIGFLRDSYVFVNKFQDIEPGVSGSPMYSLTDDGVFGLIIGANKSEDGSGNSSGVLAPLRPFLEEILNKQN